MIYSLNGKLILKDSNTAVVECGGVAFCCNISKTTLGDLPEEGANVNLFTYLSVREDAMDLYGFSSRAEKEQFERLISVSGVGAKVALSILSTLSPQQLAVAVVSNNVEAIKAAPGVGQKSAQMIIVSLMTKMKKSGLANADTTAVPVGAVSLSDNAQKAVSALVFLGFKKNEASMAVARLEPTLTVEELIKLGSQELSKLTKER